MDKVAFYKEAIYKQAEEVNKTVVNKNKVPNPKSIAGRLKQPENFFYNYNVKSRIKADIDRKTNTVKYNTTHKGFGRKNQILEGTNYYKDIPSVYKKDETESEYEARKIKNIKDTNKYVKRGSAAAVVGSFAAPLAAAALTKNPKGALLGIAPGIMAGVMSHNAGKKKANKAYMSNLKPHEKEKLIEIRNKDAEKISQNARKAHSLKASNMYFY